jgi:hypothetical protein
MSRHFFERLEQGYKGTKKTVSITCNLPYCNEPASKYKGVGSQLCEHHQGLLREYGGPGRMDRPWTFHKKKSCEFCGHDPWEHPLVKQIDNELVRDRVAWGMLIVDHIKTQRDGGCDTEKNVQTLCLDCNQVKSTLAADTMPKALYSDPKTFDKIKRKLRPIYKKLFG